MESHFILKGFHCFPSAKCHRMVITLLSCSRPNLIAKTHQNLPTSAALISLPTVVDGESHLQNTVDFNNHPFHSVKKCQYHFLKLPHKIFQKQLMSYVTSDLYTQIHLTCIYVSVYMYLYVSLYKYIYAHRDL